MARSRLSFFTWKSLESFISLGFIIVAVMVANVATFYIVPDSRTQHLLAIRLFFPCYFTLVTILIGSMLVHAFFAARKEKSLKEEAVVTEALAGSLLKFLRHEKCTYDLFAVFVKRRLFVDLYDLLCALRLSVECERGGVLNRLSKFAHIASVAASDQHAMRVIVEMEKFFSREDVEILDRMAREKYGI